MISNENREKLLKAMKEFCQLDGSDASDLKDFEEDVLAYQDPELSNEFWQLVPNAATDKHFDCIFNYGTPIQWVQLAAVANNETILYKASSLLLENKHIYANQQFVLKCGNLLDYPILKKHLALLLSLRALSDEIKDLFPKLSKECINEELEAKASANVDKCYNRIRELIGDIKPIE